MNESEQYRRDIEQWIEKIMTWDREDVYYLRDIIRDYPKVPGVQDAFDLQAWAKDQWDHISSDLPIADEYEERAMRHATYPIWTCDQNGYCLVGDVADSIVHIDDIDDIGE